MHCLGFNMLGNQLPRQSSTSNISIEIDGAEDGSEKVFDTFDCVRGRVLVSVHRKTELEKIDITFEGSSSSSVSRATPFAPGRREAYHPFLRLRQPTNLNGYTTQHVLNPGDIYRFPFEFVVPEEMLSQCCDHEVKHSIVRKAHKLLPPSFGQGETRMRQSRGDGMTPETCEISYVIRAVIHERPRKEGMESTTLCDTSREVRVIPRRNPEIQIGTDPTRPVFKKLQSPSSWISRKGGQIQLAAEQPKPIILSSLDAALDNAFEPTIDLHFGFEPSGTVSSLPRFHRIQSKLEATTYYGTVPGEDIPSSRDPANTGINREAYFATIPLACHNISSLEWDTPRSFSGSEKCPEWHEYASGTESMLDLMDSLSGSCFTASSKIPIILPSERNLVPTFHSCLVSRSYVLELTLSYSMPHRLGRSTATLRVPLELI